MATATFDKAKYQAAEIAERVPPLLLAARRIAATIEQGVHGRRRVGRGEAFWQFTSIDPVTGEVLILLVEFNADRVPSVPHGNRRRGAAPAERVEDGITRRRACARLRP